MKGRSGVSGECELAASIHASQRAPLYRTRATREMGQRGWANRPMPAVSGLSIAEPINRVTGLSANASTPRRLFALS